MTSGIEKRHGGDRLRPACGRTPIIALGASTVILLMLAAADAPAATLTPAAARAWERYYQWAEARVERQVKDRERFLIQDFLPAEQRAQIQSKLRAGEAWIERVTGVIPEHEHFAVPDAEIHHWWGAILVPDTRLPALLRFLQDYDHHGGKFADVEQSRLISRKDNHFRFFFRLRRSKAFITAYYHTIQEATYFPIDDRRVYSRSNAVRIAELENPGSAHEREKKPGDDRGFLWRLVSWWRLQETDRGVIVEIESASLSRDIPTAVKFIPGLSSYIRSTPRESMESALASIRARFAPPD